METKNNEENGVLRERFALAMERIGEIAGEATVPEAYQGEKGHHHHVFQPGRSDPAPEAEFHL